MGIDRAAGLRRRQTGGRNCSTSAVFHSMTGEVWRQSPSGARKPTRRPRRRASKLCPRNYECRFVQWIAPFCGPLPRFGLEAGERFQSRPRWYGHSAAWTEFFRSTRSRPSAISDNGYGPRREDASGTGKSRRDCQVRSGQAPADGVPLRWIR